MSLNDYDKPEVISIEAYFENFQERIKEELREARETVRICVAWLSSDSFESILKEAVSKGVQVDIVFNDDVINKKNLSGILGGVNFYPVKTKRHPNLMHNKFCIIDESAVIMGSCNWSKRAGQHFENIIIVRNDYALVEKFMHGFYDLVNHFSDAHDLFKGQPRAPRARRHGGMAWGYLRPEGF